MPSKIWSETLKRAASDNSGYPLLRVEAIAVNRYSPCRETPDYEYKVGSIGTIQRISVDYCGADPLICQGAIKGSSNLLREKFGRLSLEDVNAAFEMAAARQLGEINIIAYRGVFTVAIFGEVLEAYSKVYDQIVAALDEAEKRAAEKLQESEHDLKLAAYRVDVIEKFKALQIENTEIESPEKILYPWLTILQEAGLLKSDAKLWVEAKVATAANFKAETRKIRELRIISKHEAEKLEGRLFTQSERDDICKRLLDDPEGFPKELLPLAKKLYSRLLIFTQIAPYVQPEQNELF